MSVEALWTAQFETQSGWVNGGVIVLETGRVFGGDSQYYYKGTYKIFGNIVEASIVVNHYQGEVYTAWGTDEKHFTVNLRGELEGDTITGVMSRQGFADVEQPVCLTRREKLP